jgi:hypothetical protein
MYRFRSRSAICWSFFLVLFCSRLFGCVAAAVDDDASTTKDQVCTVAGDCSDIEDNNNFISIDAPVQERIRQLEKEAFAKGRSDPKARALWLQVLELNPRSGNAVFQLGLIDIFSNDNERAQLGADFIERSFDPNKVDHTVPISAETIHLLGFVGRFRWQRRDFPAAYRNLLWVWRATDKKDVCFGTQLSTMLHPYPMSVQEADEKLELYMSNAQQHLEDIKEKDLKLEITSSTHPYVHMTGDAYLYCVSSIFHLSFYYRADVAAAASIHYRIAAALWPQLLYVGERYRKRQEELASSDTPSALPKPCVERKIRIAIASGCMSHAHPVSNDFQGVLSRLDRKRFEVTYIYFNEQQLPPDPFVYRHRQDKVIILNKNGKDGQQSNATWTTEYFPTIENLDLDILLYLDVTMSSVARRMGYSRLATIQVNTHGHPMTSGIDRKSMDYFISWQAAELDYATAATHYTEELVLLPGEVPHQYYEPRTNSTHSLIDGGEYGTAVKYGFDFGNGRLVASDKGGEHWYVCMQKPHKFQPEVDPLFCGVLGADLNGHLVLHEEDSSAKNQARLEQRLQEAGCDMDRVHFSPALQHHKLLALYASADVILDSYPAGGCTTTREVLELGKVLVTLPARFLGGRWSYAYYTIMGDETLLETVVAESPSDYVKKAVRLATDAGVRKEAEDRIRASLPKLYGRTEAVDSWENVLVSIAPVRLADANGGCGSEQFR